MSQIHEIHDIPPVEPLADTTWRRIERDLFATLDREPITAPQATDDGTERWWHRFTRMQVGMGAALAAAAAVLLWFGVSQDPQGPQPSRIVTDEAPVALTVGRAAIQVGPESAVWIHHSASGESMFMLEQGRIDCAVVHDPERPPLIVQAGDVRVEVIGTKFSVQRSGGTAQVAVTEGAVKVFYKGQGSLVEAGQTWPTARAEAGEADSVGGRDRGDEAENSAHTEPSAAAAETPSDADEATVTADTTTDSDTATALAQPQTARSASKPKPVLDPKAAYERAASLEARDPAAALRIYRRIARGNDGWAANALFAQARLQLEQGREKPAKRNLQRYLKRFPNGPNAVDARSLLAR